ncbi:unnamed protein product [Trifolium pratense]|uniref:Uncharacterized protein n=1 Tax=Trifolium pratense TaxID=57577 RepID=A0ACB0KAQ7_TRIPR|nr:unnamed protein product [Trifolium pratense]
MDGKVQLQKQLFDYTASLFQEGFLDNQFNQLEQLQDESNPDFVVEVVTLFFDDAERILNELTTSLGQEKIDFKRLDAHVHQLKGLVNLCANEASVQIGIKSPEVNILQLLPQALIYISRGCESFEL